MKKITLPQPRRSKGGWYIPASPPHFEVDVGPYKSQYEAEDAKKGMEDTINTPLWRMVLQEFEEEEEELEQEWKTRKKGCSLSRSIPTESCS